MSAPPQAFIAGFELDFTEVVLITHLGVHGLAKESLAQHVKHHQLGPVVAAVLHQEAVLLLFLGGLDELPAVLDGLGGRHFGRCVLAVLHGREHHRNVPFPWGRGVDEVEVFLGAEPLEVARSVREGFRFALARFLREPLRSLRLLGNDVANRSQFDPVDTEESLDVLGAL